MCSVYKICNFVLLVFLLSVESKLQLIFTDRPLQRIGARIYKKELLTNKFDDPKELAYDSATRNLYFMYMDDEIQNSGRAYVNVITKQAMKIKGIEKNKATAVDNENGDVYFGSENGLYKYDPIDNVARNIGLYNINILKLVIKYNEMYLIDANTHMLYKVYDNFRTVAKVDNMKTVIEFEVDNQSNIHYVAMCGLYCITKDHEIVKNKDLNLVYHFLIDEERTLGVKEDGIYNIDCKNGTAEKLADMDFFPRSIIYGDYGDIYYSTDNDIFRLRPVSSYLIYNIYGKRRSETDV
ncbi:uncharacterized protein LOC126378170 [Pectinophora gossypiella]|nr:uncharacterized protein LOC126378170 [Pectinophora gossypiella]